MKKSMSLKGSCTMSKLEPFLRLNRCPYCSVDNANLSGSNPFSTRDNNGTNQRTWRYYTCARCGGVLIASASADGRELLDYAPRNAAINDDLPFKVKAYLQQAIDSVFAPSGSVMLCASS